MTQLTPALARLAETMPDPLAPYCIDGKLPELVWLTIEELREATYQRPFYQSWLDKILREGGGRLDPILFNPIMVNQRKVTETYHVLDGQHRIRLAQELNVMAVPAMIYPGLSPEYEEPSYWNKLNSMRKSASVWEKFQSRLSSHEETATHVKQIVEDAGFRLSSHSTPGGETIVAVSTLLEIYSRLQGPAVLQATLETIADAWIHQDDVAVEGVLIKGIATFIRRYVPDDISQSDLVRVLDSVPASKIKRDATALTTGAYIIRGRAVVKAMIGIVNKRHSGQKLRYDDE